MTPFAYVRPGHRGRGRGGGIGMPGCGLSRRRHQSARSDERRGHRTRRAWSISRACPDRAGCHFVRGRGFACALARWCATATSRTMTRQFARPLSDGGPRPCSPAPPRSCAMRPASRGNLLQRTRCAVFLPTLPAPATNAIPVRGVRRHRRPYTHGHAILGWSDRCIATHPSDFCVPLAALDATRGNRRSGRRTRHIPFEAFHCLPGETSRAGDRAGAGRNDRGVGPARPKPPPSPAIRAISKLRDRTSYAFALVSAAAALGGAGRRRSCRPAWRWAAVAAKPWRAREAEAILAGRAKPEPKPRSPKPRGRRWRTPVPSGENAYKIELARRVLVRALSLAAGRHA